VCGIDHRKSLDSVGSWTNDGLAAINRVPPRRTIRFDSILHAVQRSHPKRQAEDVTSEPDAPLPNYLAPVDHYIGHRWISVAARSLAVNLETPVGVVCIS
jgi:hypothetical protein